MSDPTVSTPHWLYPHDRARAAVLCDAATVARQRAADDVLRALLADNPDHGTFRSRLQDAMWTPADFRMVIDGKPFLHHVIDRRDLPTLLLLIAGGREHGKFVDPDDTDSAGAEAIAYARARGWMEGVQYLHTYGFTDRIGTGVRNRHTQDNDMLVHAVLANNSDVVKHLLMLGADPDARTVHDEALVDKAITLLHTDVALQLIEAGATLSPDVASLAILWRAEPPARLRAEWYEMVECLRAMGLGADFKTPHEMTAQELTARPAEGLRVMDMAVLAYDVDVYIKGLSALSGTQKVESLCKPVIAGETGAPADIVFSQGDIADVLQPRLWQGQHAAFSDLARRLQDSLALSPACFQPVFAALGRAEIAPRDKPKLKL